MPRLHVNVDHVATVRQARRETFPDPVAWALEAERAGVEGITCHLRKDRRHIQDDDVRRLRDSITTLLNLEHSLDAEMVAIAESMKPDAVCIVPENRQEITTEGGLDCVAERARLIEVVPRMAEHGALVSLFVDPDPAQLDVAAELGAHFVELHTGAYASGPDRDAELQRLVAGARHARERGLRVNAGHGLDYDNVGPVAALEGVEELNIGFAIVAHSLFRGVHEAIRLMNQRIREGAA